MKQIEINSNDAGRRLDKFMRRYLPKATLSTIYKIIISAMDLSKSGVPQLGMMIGLR